MLLVDGEDEDDAVSLIRLGIDVMIQPFY